MSSLFADKYAHPKRFSTVAKNTDRFVEVANNYIDKMYGKGLKEESFLHSIAVYLSKSNIQQGNGGPFGAIIVEYEGGVDEDGKGIGKPRVIGIGANHVVPNSDPSAHAEMEAYRDAAKRKGTSDLSGAKLFTSCECCPMCLSVANGCGISSISYVNTRAQAEDAGFSDKLQYDMFKAKPDENMTSLLGDLDKNIIKNTMKALGNHGAIVLDKEGHVYASADTDTTTDPTGVASIKVIRAAMKKYAKTLAKEAKARGEEAPPVFSLPEGFTLVCRDIPHPAGLITADWARMLRDRSAEPEKANSPQFDSVRPHFERILHVTNDYEQLVLKPDGTPLQDARITYQQPAKPDAEREVPTQHYTGPLVSTVADQVFKDWRTATGMGKQVAY